MFRFLQRFGRDSQARGRGTGPMPRARRRNHQLNCEALEGRQLLSGFYIVNAASGKVLDNSLSTSPGTAIAQWQLYGGANQQWYFNQVGGNGSGPLYTITNALSGQALTVVDGLYGGDVNQLPPEAGRPDQVFQIFQFPNGNYEIDAYDGMVLDDPGSSNSNGTDIIQYPSNTGPNQQWTLLAAGNVPAQSYNVQNAVTNLVLDDPGSSNSNGTDIIQYQFNGGANQTWTTVPLADGNSLIVNASSGLVLDDPNFSTSDGTPVDLWQINGGLNQEWQVFDPGNGVYEIRNATSGRALDLPSGSTGNGTQIIQEVYDYFPTQDWKLFPASIGVDIHGQPSNAVVGQPISPAIAVAVVDAKGNTITTNNTQLVTLSIASGPAGAKLLGTTTVRAVNGVADFTNLKLSLAGTYTLKATGGALTPDLSNVFTIAPVNVTSSVTIHRGAVHKVGRTSHRGSGGELLAQTITIKNASRQPLGGPLALRVGSLPTGVTLANATGTYEGGSYRDVLAADQPLAPGKSVTVTLDFSVSGRRFPSLSKLDEDLEALLGI